MVFLCGSRVAVDLTCALCNPPLAEYRGLKLDEKVHIPVAHTGTSQSASKRGTT